MGEFAPERLVSALVDSGVRFVIIGGVAANVLGSPELTRDLDICYERSAENLEALTGALRQVNARLRGPGLDDDVPFLLDAKTLAIGDSFTFQTDVGPLDILATPSGTGGFDDLVANSRDETLFGRPVKICHIQDLIRMKRAAGRPKDRLALPILEALRDQLDERDQGGPTGSATA